MLTKDEIRKKYSIWKTSDIMGSTETKDSDEWMLLPHVIMLQKEIQTKFDEEIKELEEDVIWWKNEEKLWEKEEHELNQLLKSKDEEIRELMEMDLAKAHLLLDQPDVNKIVDKIIIINKVDGDYEYEFKLSAYETYLMFIELKSKLRR